MKDDICANTSRCVRSVVDLEIFYQGSSLSCRSFWDPYSLCFKTSHQDWAAIVPKCAHSALARWGVWTSPIFQQHTPYFRHDIIFLEATTSIRDSTCTKPTTTGIIIAHDRSLFSRYLVVVWIDYKWVIMANRISSHSTSTTTGGMLLQHVYDIDSIRNLLTTQQITLSCFWWRWVQFPEGRHIYMCGQEATIFIAQSFHFSLTTLPSIAYFSDLRRHDIHVTSSFRLGLWETSNFK